MLLKMISGLCVAMCSFALMAQDSEPPQRFITLEESIQLALENNLDIRIQSYSPQISNFTLQGAYGGYDPVLNAEIRHSESKTPPSLNANSSGLVIPGRETESDRFQVGVSGQLPTGLTYNLFGNTSDDAFTSFNVDTNGVVTPFESYQLPGSVGVSVRQPLLKNFWIDSTRQQIRVSKKNLQISEQAFILQVMRTIAQVEQAYYDLVAAIEGVKVQEKAVELGEKTLDENRKRVEVGAMAPLDEKEAESQVATSRAELLDAQRLVNLAENNLKFLLTDNYQEWHLLEMVPSNDLVLLPQDLDVYESWSRGLSKRPDLIQAKLDLERQDIYLKYDKNQLYPSLDIVGSYGLSGNSLTYSDTFDQIADRDSPNHSIGAVFSIPLSLRAERSRYRSTKAEKEQLLWQLKRLEQSIMVDIDNAVKLARTNYERVNASREARQFAEAALDAEQKKLESGKSTTFVVLRLQRDLTDRRAAEIRAQLDYYRALTDLSLSEGTILENNDIDVEIDY